MKCDASFTSWNGNEMNTSATYPFRDKSCMNKCQNLPNQ